MFLLFAPTVDLLKAALTPGARWITIHPHGPGTDGQPVLIEPSGHDGAYRVIGGAGGKLNYLKLRGVRSEADYKAEASQRAASAKGEKKRQRERDREAGLDKSKAAAREVLKASVGDQEAKFVDTVAKALGWTDEQMRFPAEHYQNLSAPALKKLQAQHAKALVRKAQEAVDQQRKRLLQDAETRAESGLGEVPLTADRLYPGQLRLAGHTRVKVVDGRPKVGYDAGEGYRPKPPFVPPMGGSPGGGHT
jgi:hypothetical protein